MADIKFTAFVNETRTTVDGKEVWLLKTSETHRRETEQGSGEWETTGRTFRDVRAQRDKGVDLSQFSEGDRVTVTGYELTIPSTHNDQTYYNLTVYADSVELVDSETRPDRPRGGKAAPAKRPNNRR